MQPIAPCVVRQFGLEAAPTAAVTRDRDLSFHVHPAAREFLVIVRHAVVDVHQVTRDIAISSIDVVWGPCRRFASMWRPRRSAAP